MAGSSAVGTRLLSPINLAIAAAGKPVTTVIYSPFFGRLTAESYEPIPGQNLGILVQQARSEVMRGADALAARLRWAAFAVALLGAGLAVSMGLLLSRRARRLAAAELRLSESHEDSRRRLEQFLEAMPIGVFVARSNGEPYYANREAERLLGRGILPGVAADRLAEVYGVYVAGTDDPYPAGVDAAGAGPAGRDVPRRRRRDPPAGRHHPGRGVGGGGPGRGRIGGVRHRRLRRRLRAAPGGPGAGVPQRHDRGHVRGGRPGPGRGFRHRLRQR